MINLLAITIFFNIIAFVVCVFFVYLINENTKRMKRVQKTILLESLQNDKRYKEQQNRQN